MVKSKILTIIHGRGLHKSQSKKLMDFFDLNSIDYKVTYHEHHVKELLKDSGEYKGIITVGGDGTINEVINNVDITKHWFAFFPGGTVNCIPKHFKTKTNNEFIGSFLQRNSNVNLDVLKVKFTCEDRVYYKSVLGFMAAGQFANMAAVAEKIRWIPRFFRYPVSGIYNSLRLKKIKAEIRDDGKILNRKFSSLLINNVGAQHFSDLKSDKFSDGKFEYKLESNNLFTQYLSLINRYFRISYHDLWKYDKSKLQVKFEKPLDIMADGEIVKNVLELDIEIIQKEIEVKLPLLN